MDALLYRIKPDVWTGIFRLLVWIKFVFHPLNSLFYLEHKRLIIHMALLLPYAQLINVKS